MNYQYQDWVVMTFGSCICRIDLKNAVGCWHEPRTHRNDCTS